MNTVDSLLAEANSRFELGQEDAAQLIIKAMELDSTLSFRSLPERCGIINLETNNPYTERWYRDLVQRHTSAGARHTRPGGGDLSAARLPTLLSKLAIITDGIVAKKGEVLENDVETILYHTGRLQAEFSAAPAHVPEDWS
jgi:hypothetical protein